MDPHRHVEFLRLGKEHVVIGMRMGLAGHHELRDPSAFASGFDSAFESSAAATGSPSDRCAIGISLLPLSEQKSTIYRL